MPPVPDSPAFCMLPWTHLSVEPSGEVLPCCLSTLSLGALEGSSLAEKWDAPELRTLRLDMLAGRMNPACSVCHHADRAGALSLRRWANDRFAAHSDRVAATAPDGRAGELHLPYMDVRFSNACNFACRTCNPGLSTGWYKDAAKMSGPMREAMTSARTIRPLAEESRLWRELEPLLPSVEEIRFQGGEPLVMKEHYRVLDALLERGLTKVALIYNTNFSVTRFQGRDVMRLWDRFETVRVTASLDAMGSRAEYLRKGQRWADAVANRERMLTDCPRAEFSLAPTLSAMNALHLPDLHRDWVERGLVEPNSITISSLVTPAAFSAQILPASLKRAVADRYAAHARDFLGPLGERGARATAQFDAAVRLMEAADGSARLPEFKAKVAEVDALRGESFAAVFPELAELMR